MAKNIQAIRGMNDILPEQTPLWQHLEGEVRALLAGYGYDEIRIDIVEKEMYTFDDRNGDSLTLRPEGTASCVRAALENGLLHNQTHRLWYMGPMFRHERPQKGRYRQFHQIGVETFGLDGPDIDAELIIMTARLWKQLGLADDVTLQLNSLGSQAARAAYREELVAYFKAHADRLDEDSQRRLETNPLRILDSKNPAMAELNANAPKLIDHLDQESRDHFERLRELLDAAGVGYEINPCLVRGLDYYSKTVFEWVTDKLGAQGTVCAGGRFDALVEQLGGKPVAAAGFAMGIERLVSLLEERQQDLSEFRPHLYLVRMGEVAETAGMLLAEQLRDALPGLRLKLHCGGGSFKSQFKQADRSGARLALILGESEVADGVAGIKFLRGEGDQQTIDQQQLATFLSETLGLDGTN